MHVLHITHVLPLSLVELLRGGANEPHDAGQVVVGVLLDDTSQEVTE